MSKPIRSFRMAFPILKHLATHLNETPYIIEKELKIDRSTIRAALKILVKANLVAVAGKPRKLPTGLERKEYKVTPQGIVALLQAHPDQIKLTKEYVRDLARKQSAFLPLVFGKWDYFREKGAEDLAFRFLLLAGPHTEDEIERLTDAATPQKLKYSVKFEECVHRHDIYETVLVRAWTLGSLDEDPRWLEVIRGDKDLAAMAEKEIERNRGEKQEDVDTWDIHLKTLHGEETSQTSWSVDETTEEDVWDYFYDYWRFRRAKALDESKLLPTLADVTSEAVEVLLVKVDPHYRRKYSSAD